MEGDKGNFTIVLSATDHISGTVNTTFNMLVSHLPVVKQAIPNQVANIGALYQYTVAAATFFSQEGFTLFYSAQQTSGLSLPVWLEFNGTLLQFFGRPNSTDAGVYFLEIIASDEYQGQTAAVFSLIVEHFPSMNPAISLKPLLAGVGLFFSWTIPSNAFVDLDNNPFTYSALQSNGGPLPNWLSFNPQSLIFSGTPSSLDVQNLSLQLIATDLNGGQASRNFTVTVTYFPVVMTSIPKQLLNIGVVYNYTISSGTFSEADQAVLLYSVQQSNGSPLPGWLSFNNVTRQLSGQPNTTFAGTYLLEASATNPEGAIASTDFSLIVEHFPEAASTLQPPLAEVGKAYNWVAPSNAFIDLDNEVLIYSASKKDGSLLPNWLSFNPSSLLFSGTPSLTDRQILGLKLVATDGSGAQAQQIFNLTVTNFPVVMTAIPKQLLNLGVPYNYTIPDTTFSEADQAVLLYSAQQSNGQPLPGWLNFNNTTRQLSAWPNVTDAGTYLLEVSATNPVGATASTDFSLIVEYFPQVNNPLRPPLVAVGKGFNWVVPSNAFIDLDDNLLTYTASKADGSLLPNWLSFNPSSLLFSGTPSSTDAQTMLLQLVATDSNGAQAQQWFNLTVTNFPVVVTPIPPQLLNMGVWYNYTIPSGTFSTADQAVLLYSVQQSHGGSLPGWLNFNNVTRQLSGQPNATAAETYLLEASVTNPEGAIATTDFSLIVEHFPEVFYPIPSQLADINQLFTFTVPVNSFLDKDSDPLTYTSTTGSGKPLPNWLVFNPQNQFYSGVPLETDRGNLSLAVIATDLVGASVTSNFTLQVIHFPVVANFQSTVVERAVPFAFSVPTTSFDDVDQVGLSYSTSPLPSWLTFDSQRLRFSGNASINDIGTVTITVVANDTRGASVGMNFNLVIRDDVPPVVTQALSTQVATVGQAFSSVLPPGLFFDAHNNSLVFNVTQQDGSLLPDWLSFDNQSLSFSGTPGHGDTNFYATRTVGIEILAKSVEGQASANFNIEVGGVSWGQLAITIGAPLISFLTTLYALYEYRALLLNPCRKNKYTLMRESNPTAVIGQPFAYTFTTPREEIHHIRTAIPLKESKGCCQFFKPKEWHLPGSDGLPWWLIYDQHSNTLRSKGVVPTIDPRDELVVQAEDEAGVILEKFTIHIVPQNQKIREMESKEDEREDAPGLEVAERADPSSKTQIELMPFHETGSFTRDTDTLIEIGSPSGGSPSMMYQHRPSQIPRPSVPLESDSPLIRGSRTTRDSKTLSPGNLNKNSSPTGTLVQITR